ncbi:hypothetical protein B4099_2651 [Heyndrickxia coagulans]|uniref:UPF0756 membrane protein B4099_2651 n=2 Tax=Heyndrickxia coagulans TaxID=1398 RepID=A0A150JZM6_HEYCO|nr:hypothetical protein B4099_2651 [Heyndrickxia coagulans]
MLLFYTAGRVKQRKSCFFLIDFLFPSLPKIQKNTRRHKIFSMKEGMYMYQPYLFLLLLLAIGFVAKNQSLIISVIVLLVLKVAGLDAKIFSTVQSKGINWGVTIITIAVLVPIATGQIGFKDLYESLKSPYAWIALASGIIVALLAKNGITLLASDPQITTALVLGTILAVSLFKGVAVGPLIGAGIAWMAMKIVEWVTNSF